MNHDNLTQEQLLEKVSRLETEINMLKTQKELLSNNAELIVWGTDTAVWDWNYKTGVVIFSDKKAQMLGYEPAELNHDVYGFTKMIHPDDYEYTMENMKNHLSGKTEAYEVEYRIKAKNGEWKWFFDKGKIVERDKDHSPLRIIGIVNDITEKKNILTKLKENKQRFENLFNLNNDGIRIVDTNGIIINVNQRMCELTGFSFENTVGKYVWDVIFRHAPNHKKTPELLQQIKTFCLVALKTGQFPFEKQPNENALQCADGSLKIVETSYFAVPEKNEYLLYSIIHDVTEFRNSQNELIKAKEKAEENEKKFRLLVENSNDSFWIIDLNYNYLYLAPVENTIFGYTYQESLDLPIEALHKPEEYARIKEYVRQRLNEYYAIGNKEPIYLESECLHKNGQTVFIEIVAKFIINAEGQITAIQGTTRNITKRKLYELELIQAKEKAEEDEEKYKLFHEYAGIGIGYYSPDGIIISYNQIAAKYMNGNPEHFTGKSIFDIFPKPYAEFYYNRIQDAINSPEPTVYEDLVQLPNEEKWFLSTFTKIVNSKQNVLGIQIISQDITKLKKFEFDLQIARQKAEESEEKNRTLLDTMFEGVTLNELIFNEQGDIIDYRIIEANASFDNHSQIKRNEIAGKLATDVYKMSSEYINDFWTKNLKNNKLISTDYYSEESGNWTRVKTSPVKDNKFTITLFDITEQKNAEQIVKQKSEEIELQNSRLESLLKITQYQTNSIQELLDFALNEAIILTASQIGYIYFYNEEKKQFILNTWSKEVMKECAIRNPLTTYNLDETGCWGEAVRQRKPIVINQFHEENPLKKGIPEGHIILKKFLTIPVIFDDKIVAVCGVANKLNDYDNSDIRQLSLLMDSVWKISERITLIKDLTLAKERAEESNQLKSAFLQNMSHEVRTPLNAITGFAQLMSKPNQTPEKQIKFSEIILENSEKLIGIITDVIEISQIQTFVTKPKITAFDVFEMIHEIEKKFKHKITEKKLELQIEINIPQPNYYIHSDKEKLQRILLHLIDNAIKFTTNGSVKLICEVENQSIKFTIIDTGIGISQEMQKLIFEPFRQVETEISRNVGGNGLGLSLAKAYIDLLNGSISLTSELNSGTTFYISIPTNKMNSQTNEIVSDTKKIPINTILIAEDEYSNYQYLLALLDETNLKILYAENGQQAVDVCRKNNSIDLILMDIKMPVMDGYTAAKLIKGFRENLPIIAQTAYALENEREKFIGIFDDYITKPISAEILNQKIIKYIEKQ